MIYPKPLGWQVHSKNAKSVNKKQASHCAPITPLWQGNHHHTEKKQVCFRKLKVYIDGVVKIDTESRFCTALYIL